jgi:hypothetical protein
MHLAAQEAQSAVSLERYQQELAAAEQERERRRALLDLQTRREELALFRDRAALEREQADRDLRRRRTEDERAAARATREREVAADRMATVRSAWEAKWMLWAGAWLDRNLGDEGDRRKLASLVRRNLEPFDPRHPYKLVAYCLERGMHAEFDGEIAAKKRREAEEASERTAREAARAIAGHSDVFPLILPWARLTLTMVDADTLTGKVVLIVLLRQIYERILTDEVFAAAMLEYVRHAT